MRPRRRFGRAGARVALLARGADGPKAARQGIEEEGCVALDPPCDVTDRTQVEGPSLLAAAGVLAAAAAAIRRRGRDPPTRLERPQSPGFTTMSTTTSTIRS